MLKNDFNENKLQIHGKETFLDIYNLWIKQYEKDVEESTLKKTLGLFKNHILPAMGEFIISNLNSLVCQELVNTWSDKIKSAKNLKSYASNVLEFAKKHDFISSNPFDSVTLPKKRKKFSETTEESKNYYTKNELVSFLEALKNDGNLKIQTFFYLLALTGMRKGEAFALKWKDIDFANRTISINKAISHAVNNKLYVKSTKTGKSRTIYIDEKTIELLKEWRKTQYNTYETLGYNTLNPEQLIFSNLENQHIQPSITSRWLNKIITKYNLPHITTHGLRHTHCTLLAEAKVDIKSIQQRLGHSNVQTTLNTYTHALETNKIQSADIFVNYIVSQ
ncbi:site-specific integrase [Lysinibacillus sphaericus]|uniref:tyrosine-type recombinase/integrase n=1 Tax=Lysinibacillus sphaericus TaxID=1421 RepID=UPI0018CF461C|nr:site-specific integrase [Lysinibacillus sphaericus]QTB12949.1 site-specific integrase [Lysinibacillus sphaericus]